jgi:hypothetical protein
LTEDIVTARRRTLIDIVRRRQRPGSGSQPWRRDEKLRLNWPNLAVVLSGVPWAIVGAVATRRYMPERSTADLDIAILPVDAGRAAERLEAAGYTKHGPPAIGGASWEAPGGISVDVIEGSERWWPEALGAAKSNFDDNGAPVLPLPYLVLMKTVAGRFQDVADVARMLGYASDEELAKVREIIAEFAPFLREDIEAMIVQGKLETERG